MVDELELFNDAECSNEVSVPSKVQDVTYSCCYDCESYGVGVSELAIQDDSCSDSCGSSSTVWAGCDTADAQAPRSSW